MAMNFYANYPVSAGGGVSSLNGLTGALTLVAGQNIVITPLGTNITIGTTGLQPIITIGALDSQAPNANGLALVANVLSTQSADATHPGMVNTAAQTFTGDKTFAGNIFASADSTYDIGTPTTRFNNGWFASSVLIGETGSSLFGYAELMPTGITGGTLRLGLNGPWQQIGFDGVEMMGEDSNGYDTFSFKNNAVPSYKFYGSSNTPIFTLTDTGLVLPGTIAASNFSGTSSGTNTGDVTIGTADGLSLSGQVLSLALASTSTTGALSSTDWNTFNAKAPAGSYLTALTGDATATGPGSAALTLATVNSNVGAFGSASSVATFTVNAKGLTTAASSVAIQITESQVTNLTTDLAGKLTSTLTSGDIFVGSAGNVATAVAVTGAITVSNSGVTTYAGTVPLNKGGTGQTTKAAAFDALQPMTTGGDLIYGGASGTGTRLANGTSGQVLTSAGGTAAPTWVTPTGAAFKAPTIQRFITAGSGTYTTPTSPAPLYLRVQCIGGGGGGGGSGTTPAAAGAGGNTLFNSSSFGGFGGSQGVGNGGAGGISAGGNLINATGSDGGSGMNLINASGGSGGTSAFGGGGAGGTSGTGGILTGTAGTAFGGGGGGGSAGAVLGTRGSGGGGGAGGYCENLITGTLASTYTYSVGAGGTAGGAGTGGSVGGAGSVGAIFVTEYYE